MKGRSMRLYKWYLTMWARCAVLLGVCGVAVFGFATDASAVSMATNANGPIIAAEGPRNTLDFYWAVNGNPTWNPEQVAGPGSTYSPPSITKNANGPIIAVEGPGNSLDFYWAVNGNPTWHFEQVAGPGTTYSAPSITANANGPIIAAEGPVSTLDFY